MRVGGPGADALILALDQGTTNSKALLVDAVSGTVVSTGARPVGIAFPGPGEVEQDAEDIWAATLAAIGDCLDAADDPPLAGVAISNQRESVAIWDAVTGEPLGPVLGWQDARTAAECADLADRADLVRGRTGLPLDPMFSAPKMRWLLDRAPAGSDPRVGTVETFLAHRLTGELVAEAGNASRTLLASLETCDWDPDLMAIFGIPRHRLAPVVRSDARVGVTRPGLRLPVGVPVLAMLADSHAALYFHGGGAPGRGKATYGTGSSVMVPAPGRTAPGGVAATLAWLTDRPLYAREGNILASGAAIAWMADLLTGGDVAALGGLAESRESTSAVFVPAFSGLGAPYFDRRATGLLAGITGGTGPADLARAVLESVAHQVADVVEAVEADGEVALEVLHTDGGATASALLMRIQADLLGREVRVSRTAEASALGAARMAASALGATAGWTALEGPEEARVAPRMGSAERGRRRRRWREAVRRARGQALDTMTYD